MALRSQARILRYAANKSESVISGEGGLRGFMERLQQRLKTGKILRPDVVDDVLRKPVGEAKYRYPSPGAQQPPVVPQGPYQNVFDIAYHSRDSRRRHTEEQINAADAATAGLPPTPGSPVKSTFLGMAGDFDVNKS